MVTYHSVDRIEELSLSLIVLYNKYDHENIIHVNQLTHKYND